jgi:hypothetical protein
MAIAMIGETDLDKLSKQGGFHKNIGVDDEGTNWPRQAVRGKADFMQTWR